MITRRQFMGGLTGAAVTLGPRPRPAAAEPPPETTKLTLARAESICQVPQYIADTLFEAEGFTDVQFLRWTGDGRPMAAGQVQLTMTFAAPMLLRIDAGDPIVLLGAGHVGCQELVVNEHVRTMRDLKGKRVQINAFDNPQHVLLAMAMAHVGLDHRKDVTLRIGTQAEAVRSFEAGQIDALVVSPPIAQELRARKVGRVLIDTARDRPWSQYFCCMVVGNREFVRRHPAATKRAMRAILKSADVCAADPARAARALVDKGFTPGYEPALQTIKELPYGKWRDYDPEDTIRFYALRLYEAGMIKSNPQKLIAHGTDWRFHNELRKELKG